MSSGRQGGRKSAPDLDVRGPQAVRQAQKGDNRATQPQLLYGPAAPAWSDLIFPEARISIFQAKSSESKIVVIH